MRIIDQTAHEFGLWRAKYYQFDNSYFVCIVKYFDEMRILSFIFIHTVNFDMLNLRVQRSLGHCDMSSSWENGNAFDMFYVITKFNEIHFLTIDILSGQRLSCWENNFRLVFILIAYCQSILVHLRTSRAKCMN